MVTPRVASSSRRKICASPRTSSWAVGSSRSTTPAPRRTAHTRTREGHALPLASGEVDPAGVLRREHRVERREVVGPGGDEGGEHVLVGGAVRRDVVAQRQLEAGEVLEHRGDPAAPLGDLEVAQVDPVGLDGTRRRVVEPAQQLGERGLAGAVLADDGQRRPGRDRQVEAAEHLALGARVGEARRRGSGSPSWAARRPRRARPGTAHRPDRCSRGAGARRPPVPPPRRGPS